LALTAPFVAGADDFGFQTRGTVTTASRSVVGFRAPVSSLLTVQFDNAGSGFGDTAQIRPRVNGVAYSGHSAAGGQGGNYARADFFLGSRGGTSQFLNGGISSVVLYAAPTAATPEQIATMEAWCNQREMAY
jgi:hypothetical protein